MSVAFQAYQEQFSNTSHEVDALANEEKIRRILELKEEKQAAILGHNYMNPLIYNLSNRVERGDSLALARYVATTDNPLIVFDGVLFMAETAKILNPEKKVLIASKEAGCSLADPIRAGEVRRLRAQYPQAPVVTYINSYADVKAESDICCTSANAVAVIIHMYEQTKSNTIIFLPDSLMGANLQMELDKLGIPIRLVYPGKNNLLKMVKCEVHDQFAVEDLLSVRAQYDIPKGHPNRAVMAHWECRPEVLAEADFYGSTSQMARFIQSHDMERVYLVTECEMAANLVSEFPQVEFVRSCQAYCQYMRKITLDGILSALETEDPEKHEINVDPALRYKALVPIQRMLDLRL